MEYYRLQTSFVIRSHNDIDFIEKAKRFQEHLSQYDDIQDVSVQTDNQAHRAFVKFTIGADEFRQANYRSGRIILEALAHSDVPTGDLTEIEQLKDIRSVEKASRRYLSGLVKQFSPARV